MLLSTYGGKEVSSRQSSPKVKVNRRLTCLLLSYHLHFTEGEVHTHTHISVCVTTPTHSSLTLKSERSVCEWSVSEYTHTHSTTHTLSP